MPPFFTTPEGIGLTLAVLIFLIAIFLVSMRLINFFITLLLLLFSLATGFIISNNEAFRDYLKNRQQKEQMERYETFSTQILKAFDELKQQVADEKKPVVEEEPSQ